MRLHCSVNTSLHCQPTTQLDSPHQHAMSLLHWKCEMANNRNVRRRCHDFGTRCTLSAEKIAKSVWASDRIFWEIQPSSQSGIRLYCRWWHQPSCMSCNAGTTIMTSHDGAPVVPCFVCFYREPYCVLYLACISYREIKLWNALNLDNDELLALQGTFFIKTLLENMSWSCRAVQLRLWWQKKQEGHLPALLTGSALKGFSRCLYQ